MNFARLICLSVLLTAISCQKSTAPSATVGAGGRKETTNETRAWKPDVTKFINDGLIQAVTEKLGQTDNVVDLEALKAFSKAIADLPAEPIDSETEGYSICFFR